MSEVKLLRRDMDNAILGGVCAGIAKYFSIDPTLVRFITIISGVGLFTYCIAWIIIPAENKTQG
jgi:phage shock protein PspC (stress-responsive transcriptional regulator)